MEKLKYKYQGLVRVLKALESSLERYEIAKNDGTIDILTRDERRDSSIKRFELTYELFWKYLKEYLFVTYGVVADSPKKVFHACDQQALVNNQQAKELLVMVDNRNMTTHIYDEDVADEIAAKITVHARLIKRIIVALSPK